MKTLKVNGPISMPHGMKMEPGETYVMSGGFAKDVYDQVTRQFPGIAELDPVPAEQHYKRYEGQDLSGKTILIFRTGGAGDLMFLTPAMRYIKERWPDCTLIVSCYNKYLPLFAEHPHVDEVRPYPVNLKWFDELDYQLCFEGLIEQNPASRTSNAVDLFCRAFGFDDVPEDRKQPILACTEAAIRQTDETFRVHGFTRYDPIVGIQWKVDAPKRRYPPPEIVKVAKELSKINGAKIVWFGSPAQIGQIVQQGIMAPGLASRSLCLSAHPQCRSWGHVIAAAAKCDLVIGADSGVIHAAAAAKPTRVEPRRASLFEFNPWTPTLGIYGPFRTFQRLAKYRWSFGIDVDASCAGCNQHNYDECDYGFPSPCFDLIKPEYIRDVAGRILALVRKRRGEQGLKPKHLQDIDPYEQGLDEWVAQGLAPYEWTWRSKHLMSEGQDK
jgi:ADP-heptose:LPS heptosyltransferase